MTETLGGGAPAPPVFFDPGQRRWGRFKLLARLLLGALSLALGALVTSVLVNPALPGLGLPPVRGLPQARHLAPPRPERPVVGTERRFRESRGRLAAAAAAPPTPVPAAADRHTRTEVIGFFVNWDDTSLTSLKENVGRLDKLIPEWLHLDAADGTIVPDAPARQEEVMAFLRSRRPELPVVPLVNNFSSERLEWESEKLAAMLARKESRRRTVEQLLSYVAKNHHAGVSVDFEDVPQRSRGDLVAFLTELGQAFHARGLEVSASVPMDDDSFDYRGCARAVDTLILMAYDEHSGETEAGPVASQGWYAENLARRFAEVPANRWVVALGSYGYDWQDGASTGREVSFQEAIRTAQESEGRIVLDRDTLNSTYDYYDDADALHHVWFLDAVTAFNQVHEASRNAPRGFALWRLGSEDPSVWSVLAAPGHLDGGRADELRALRYGYDVDYEGNGEVLQVTSMPREGRRALTWDPASGLVVRQKLVAYPSSYVITRRGAGTPRKIALTFDDGPDSRFTPQVLDVLKTEGVKATFFIIGLNGDLHPALLTRIYREGHEIGSHTFTHPNIATVNPRQLRLEINATERLLEARLGHRSLLFRPPYAEDVEPETPEQVEPLLFTSAMGLYTIGMGIDPNDWTNPGSGRIVEDTLRQAHAGQGSVVLLHDGGGDRSQTLQALPEMIGRLRRDGFELVTVSSLLGLGRDAVMPAVPRGEKASLVAGDAGFLLIWLGRSLLRVLFLLGLVLGILRLLVIVVLAVVQKATLRTPRAPEGPAPTVAVVIPAFNEEKVIVRTVESLLGTDESFEVLVVDDGSTDGTSDRVVEAFRENPRVRVLRKVNAGKAAALNYGMRRTNAEIVVALDADTLFRPGTVRALVAHFADPRVGAVAGNAKVGNRINLLTRWQALEYVTSQNLDRRALDLLNGITVVPGAVGAWRRSLVLSAGGFAPETLAEDADMTLAILRAGQRIRYEETAVAATEVPDRVRGFLNQRFRWMYGTMQAGWKHRDALLRPRFGALGLFALPNLFLFQVLFPLVSPFMDLELVLSLGVTFWQRREHPGGAANDALESTLFYYAVFAMADLLAALVAFALERGEDPRLLIWLPLQRFFYRQLMYVVAIRSVLTAVRGPVVGWGKLERKATVT